MGFFLNKFEYLKSNQLFNLGNSLTNYKVITLQPVLKLCYLLAKQTHHVADNMWTIWIALEHIILQNAEKKERKNCVKLDMVIIRMKTFSKCSSLFVLTVFFSTCDLSFFLLFAASCVSHLSSLTKWFASWAIYDAEDVLVCF